MAAGFTVEEVREIVMESDDDTSSDISEELNEDEQKLSNMLDGFDGGENFHQSFFKENAIRLLLPLYQAAKQTEDLAEQSQRHAASSLLSKVNINAGSLLRDELINLLKMIDKRLAGRVSIRRPYQGEIQRNIPYEIFSALKRVIRNADDECFQEPRCYIASNREAEVISFTTLGSLLKLISLVTALSTREVRKYFSRTLKTSSRSGNRVQLIVSDRKDFALVYKISCARAHIQFNYGEWNADGFPLHNCDLADLSP